MAYAESVVSDKNLDLVAVRKLKHDILEQTQALNDEMVKETAETILVKKKHPWL